MRGLVASVALLMAAAAWAADVTVELVTVSEFRQVQVRKPKSDGFTMSGETPGLTLKLELRGPVAGKATHYGKLTLAEALDDRGTKLTLRESGFGNDPSKEFVEIDRDFMFFGRDEDKDKAVELELPLTLPARDATKLKAVKGSVVLREIVTDTVTIDDVLAKRGEALKDPMLEAAGLKIRIQEAPKDEDGAPEQLTLIIEGDRERLMDADLIDAAGEELSGGSMSMTMNDREERSLYGGGPLAKDVKLRLKVAKESRDVTVPIEMENVTLP